MEQEIITITINNWSNLPKKVIKTIFNYTPIYHRLTLRFISKHWNQQISSLLFNKLDIVKESESSYIMNKYGNNFKILNNFGAEFRILMRNGYYELGNLERLNWKLETEEDFKSLTHVMNTSGKINFISFCEDEYNPFTHLPVNKWGHLISNLIDYPSLEGIFINFKCGHLLPLFTALPLLSLKKYILKINSNQLNQCIKVIKQSQYLNYLSLEFKQYEDEGNYIYLSNLVNFNGPISNKLEYFKLLMHQPNNIEVNTFKNHLGNLMLGILSNPNASNLKSLYFNLSGCGIDLGFGVFNEPITVSCLEWTKLTKLSFFSIDKYLMSHIFKYCPNLKELSFGSSLVLPFDKNLTDTKPLKYLTKLSFRGFHIDLINQTQDVQHFFPNVATLSLHLSHSQTGSVIMDAFYIPSLFPNVNRVIMAAEDYNLNRLIDEWEGNLSWEELYLSVSSSNKHLLNFILAKLPKLSQLYIHHGYLDSKLDRTNVRPTKAKIYSVKKCEDLSFYINIHKKLNI